MATHDIVVIADYVSVMVKGAMNLDNFKQITDETLIVCQDKDIRKVVIDVPGSGGFYSDTDKFEFATYASAKLKNDIDQYAYVYPKELITYTPQVISQGSGFNVRGFTSIDDALIWLDNS